MLLFMTILNLPSTTHLPTIRLNIFYDVLTTLFMCSIIQGALMTSVFFHLSGTCVRTFVPWSFAEEERYQFLTFLFDFSLFSHVCSYILSHTVFYILSYTYILSYILCLYIQWMTRTASWVLRSDLSSEGTQLYFILFYFFTWLAYITWEETAQILTT